VPESFLDPSGPELRRAPRKFDDRANRVASTSAPRKERSSCPCARMSACRCVWPLAKFAGAYTAWIATSASRDSSALAIASNRRAVPSASGTVLTSLLANQKFPQQVERLPAQPRVCVVQARVKRGPADLRHDGPLGFRRTFVDRVSEPAQSAQAKLRAR